MTHNTREVEEIQRVLMDDGFPDFTMKSGNPFSKYVADRIHQQLQKAQTEKFVDGMIAATQWLIDNGHLKAGKELNEMMLKALVSHSELDQDKV